MTLIVAIGAPFSSPLVEQWMVDPFIIVVTLLTIIWLVNGLPDVRVLLNAVESNVPKFKYVALTTPTLEIIASRFIAR